MLLDFCLLLNWYIFDCTLWASVAAIKVSCWLKRTFLHPENEKVDINDVFFRGIFDYADVFVKARNSTAFSHLSDFLEHKFFTRIIQSFLPDSRVKLLSERIHCSRFFDAFSNSDTISH